MTPYHDLDDLDNGALVELIISAAEMLEVTDETEKDAVEILTLAETLAARKSFDAIKDQKE